MTQKTKLLAQIVQNEDWLALLIGLALAALVGIGVIVRVPWPLFGLLQ